MNASAIDVGAMQRQCDVLVIGGGPDGATVSSLLVEEGWNVALLEKEHHPRFHISESLLAMNLSILKRLSVLEQVAAIGVPKYGAYFVSHLVYRSRSNLLFQPRAGQRLSTCPRGAAF
jgi:2-polyprenyl-6-methoxyphenol hydroxylase-like FAD-dependent oxidoreductase